MSRRPTCPAPLAEESRRRAFAAVLLPLRRYLVDEGFLARVEGSCWRTGGSVDL